MPHWGVCEIQRAHFHLLKAYSQCTLVVYVVAVQDEFGRDGSMGRQRHMETRRGQRMERRALRRAKRMDGGEPDGWSTSEDESFPKLDAPLYILHDVENDYVKLEIILQRFATWRRRHLDMYSNAYGQDSVAKISVPFAELEIVPWKPLQQPNLENFGFYGEILNYAKDSPYPGDASILPKVRHTVLHGWCQSNDSSPPPKTFPLPPSRGQPQFISPALSIICSV